MRAVFVREIRLNMKQLIIWSLTVGILGLVCILMYNSMQGDMKSMADMFSQMGAFSDAFGMSTLSIATVEGFFATEVGTVHGLGGAMFAAILAIGIISKEEDGHTGEFLLSLPISRRRVVAAKGGCVLVCLAAFSCVCALFYALGFVMLGEDIPFSKLAVFMAMQLLMNIEISAICFFISGVSPKINIGAGLGVALICYVYDLVGRVVPDMKDYLFIGPYSYANASEIFSGADIAVAGVAVGLVITVVAYVSTFVCFDRRDLAS